MERFGRLALISVFDFYSDLAHFSFICITCISAKASISTICHGTMYIITKEIPSSYLSVPN